MLVITPTKSYVLPDKNGIVIVIDHQPPSPTNATIEADFETASVYQDQSYNNIEQIIKDHNIDVEHVYLDHYLYWLDFPYPHTCIPTMFLEFCDEFLLYAIPEEYSDEQNCFIMMNKRRENRLLVSAWFSQNKNVNFDYSQGWEVEYNDYNKIEEYTRLTPYKLGSFLNKKFIPYKNNVDGLINGCYNEPAPNKDDSVSGIKGMWNNIFKEKFCSSTFSIVAEPNFWEKGCLVTEKYLMTLYGCCFPIFCGGYGLPDQLTRIGFDVFDDIIDHSYQYEAHPGIRVLNALELNRELLENHSVKKLDYMDRHLKNLSLVREHLDSFKLQFSNSQFDRYRSSL